MSELLNPIAEVDTIDSGIIATPEEAILIKDNHSFFCPDYDCKDPARRLIIKKSTLGNCFFSHFPECEHKIRPETLLHKLAIKWFENKTEFEVPKGAFSNKHINKQVLKLNVEKTILEYSHLKTIRPDVKLCTVENFEFAIEIVVTNDIDQSKNKLIEQFGLPTIRIDLTEFYKLNADKCRLDKQFVEQHLNGLLTNVNLKEWIVFPKTDEHGLFINTSQQSANNTSWIAILSVIGVLWIINKLRKSKTK